MSHTAAIFGKSIYDLTLDDLNNFFSTDQEETALLEFKSADVQYEGIFPEISAFLNTEGGVLILGAPKERSNGKSKCTKGKMEACTKIVNQDRLAQKIASHISPTPVGLKFKTIYLGEQDQSAFIIEIPQSVTPPHQVNNNGCYYIRLEREAKPAPHGLVEALFNQRQKPNLHASISIEPSINKPYLKLTCLFTNESLTGISQYGFMLEILGVKKIIESTHLGNKYLLQDNILKVHQDLIKDIIIIKGIHQLYIIEFLPQMNEAWIQLTYYSINIPAEHLLTHISFENLSKIELYDSKNNQFNKPKADSLLKAFDNLQKVLIKASLEEFQDVIYSMPATIETCLQLELSLGIELPMSYLHFLRISDGIFARSTSGTLQFFSVEQIESQTEPRLYGKEFDIILGKTARGDVWLIYEDIPKFQLRWKDENNKIKYYLIGSSFLDVLDFFNEKDELKYLDME